MASKRSIGNFDVVQNFPTITVSWCSWLSRQSNTLKVSGSNPGEAILTSYIFSTISNVGCELDDYTGLQIQ